MDESIVNMDVLYGFRIFDEDKTLHRQLKGINAVKFMLAHVDRMLEVYQRECETSSNEIIQRRWKVIQMMYLDREKKKSTKEIAEFYNMELSTIQKDAKEARNDLTVLFFVNSTDDIVYGAIRRSFDCKECGCCTRSFSRVAGEIPATLLKLNISNMKSHI